MTAPSELTTAVRIPRVAAVVVVWFPLGLWIDTLGGAIGTTITSIVTWLLLLHVARVGDRPARRALIVCVIWSTIGEIVLTELLGLYTYRFGFVPPFVPPGHALLFQLGVWTTACLGERSRHVLRLLAALATFGMFGVYGDQQSLVFFAMFALLVRVGPNPGIYGTMFFLALGLELVGTAIGTWAWAPRDPNLGLSTCNPPVAAGSFYCALDALVIAATVRVRGSPPR